MGEALRLMREAFAALRAGAAINHPRRRVALPTGSVLHYMAAGGEEYFGAKVYATHPQHGAHFWFLLFRAADAAPLAVMEANALGRIRTGAASGYAAELLAREDAATLAVIGSGFQARTQVEAMLCARPGIRQVRVWSRSVEKRTAFAAECSQAFGVPVEAAASAEQAVGGADILVTATNARDPVVRDEWVAPGTLVAAMGSNQARRRELPAELVRRCSPLVVDSIGQARMESGDLLLALEEPEWARVVELKDEPHRVDSHSVALFKSHGLAIEDVAVAGFVYERAMAAGYS